MMVVQSICRWESMSWPETGTKMWRVKPVNGNIFFTEFIFITVCTNSVMSIRFISSTNFPHPIGSLAEISTYFPDLLQRGLVRERPFNLKGGGGLCFFSKKIFWFPMLLKKIFWFWWRKKKIIWFRVFVI